MYKIVIFLIAIISSQVAVAQSSDNYLFNLLCGELLKTEENKLLKEDLKALDVVYDPTTGREDVWFPEALDSHSKSLISKYTKKELLAILLTPDMSVFPLPDTLYIVDTTAFLEAGMFFDDRVHFVVTGSCPTQYKKCIYLLGTALRRDDLILSFALSDSNEICNFYFKTGGAPLSHLKVLRVNGNHRE